MRGRGVLALLGAVGLATLTGRTTWAGTLIVSDSSQVLQFNAQTGAFVGGPANGLANPHGICYRGDGSLFVGVDGANTILRYDGWVGTFFGAFVTVGSGGLNSPQYITSGPDGNLYVSSTFSDQVLRYNGTTGAFIDAFVGGGSGGLHFPKALAFGPDGNLYVASAGTTQVLRYDGTTGAFIGAFVTAGSGGLFNPFGMQFGPDGNLYVSSFSTNQVLRYNGTTGAFMDAFVTAGSGGLNSPDGLSFGPDSNLYVCSPGGAHQVLRYNGTTGAFIDVFVAAGAGTLGSPSSLVFLPPTKPTGLVASYMTGTQINLDWVDTSDDETGFTLWRKGNGSDWTQIASLPANTTHAVDTGLAVGTPYGYRVRATSRVGNSPWSNELASATASPVPATPSNLAAIASTGSQVSLTWRNNDLPSTSFVIWRKVSAGSYAFLAAVGPNVTSYDDTGLQSETLYTYRVRAMNSYSASADWSNEAAVWTPAMPPPTPSSLTATPITSSRINLTWSLTTSNETAVVIWRKTGVGAFARVAVLPPGSTSYADTGLTGATAYSYEVRTTNNYFASPWSNVATATTP
jgi:hypothetical protein